MCWPRSAGQIEEVVLEARTVGTSSQGGPQQPDQSSISGLAGYSVELQEHIQVSAAGIHTQ